MLALVLHLGGVGECVSLIWERSVYDQESGDLHDESSPSSVEHVRTTESQMTQKAPPGIGRLAIDEAWKWHEKYTSLKLREKNKMFCRIICDHCSVEGRFGVMVAMRP